MMIQRSQEMGNATLAWVTSNPCSFLPRRGTARTSVSVSWGQPVRVVKKQVGNRWACASARASGTSWPTLARTYVTRDRSGLPVINVSGLSRPQTPAWLIVGLFAAVAWVLRRLVILRHLRRPYKRVDLSKDIADFYDLRSAAWEDVWGEHLHHGLYDVVDGKRLSGRIAQVRSMSELLIMGGLGDTKLPAGAKILDVGCGIGGASRYLAKHFGGDCHVTGITLSPIQAERATELNKQAGLEGRVTNEVRNAMDTRFPDDTFDVVWSMESAEHMDNKQLFLDECQRVLKPGGRIVMLAWCIRESNPALSVAERFSIRRIMEEYCLPRLAPASEYNTGMVRTGLRGVEHDDWTKRAAPFWGEVVRSAIFNPKGLRALRTYGWPLIRSALAMRHVIAGIKQGVFRLVAFSGRKPTPAEKEEEAKNAIECRNKRPLRAE